MCDLDELKSITSNLTLLYVEDDRDIANSFVNYLSKFFKEVVYVEDGDAALNMYKEVPFDLVITDINMPNMDGITLSTHIKDLNDKQNIMIVSAYSEVEHFLDSIKIGIDGYIIKPINYDLLNSVLFKTVSKIQILKDNARHKAQLEVLLRQLDLKNKEFQKFIVAVEKVALITKINMQNEIVYVNDLYLELTKHSLEELEGQSHTLLYHEDMTQGFIEKINTKLQSNEVWEGTIKYKSKDNEIFFVHEIIVPIQSIENDSINEYVSIGFLTTKEELGKRQFKKQVMTNQLEFKKTYRNSIDRISDLEKEISSLKNEKSTYDVLNQDYQTKYKKLLQQVKHYEEELKNYENKYEKNIASYKKNNEDMTNSYSEAMKKSKSQSKEIERLDTLNQRLSKEVLSLNKKLNDQKDIIVDLKSTIKVLSEDNKNQ